MTTKLKPFDPTGFDFISHLKEIGEEDAAGLETAAESYGPSWKQRGGVGAFMMMARKWDRLENRVKMENGSAPPWDIFAHVENDQRAEGLIDDIRDLRRYLMLVEADLRSRGFEAQHRDNAEADQVDQYHAFIEQPEVVLKRLMDENNARLGFKGPLPKPPEKGEATKEPGPGETNSPTLRGIPIKIGDALFIRDSGSKVPGWDFDPVGRRLTVVDIGSEEGPEPYQSWLVKVRLVFAPRPGQKPVTEEWWVNPRELEWYRDARPTPGPLLARKDHPAPFGYDGDG